MTCRISTCNEKIHAMIDTGRGNHTSFGFCIYHWDKIKKIHYLTLLKMGVIYSIQEGEKDMIYKKDLEEKSIPKGAIGDSPTPEKVG